ncbi:hypothetical protein JK628_02820 [Shewanella sp. KX20019]|uniref:hypothetical protein n=1 Tax=Shewanella sp. KX20019 TaxID=2803864 RepID=UPI00192662D7|nr:hypothetical protein [Shewanella sp. KX20019]QQX80822.1 hypothetical protein JK628_02820 [Shewanella sp. KX20019]
MIKNIWLKYDGWIVLLLVGMVGWGGLELYKLNAELASAKSERNAISKTISNIDNKLNKLLEK